MWLWTSIAELLLEEDPDYFKAFWTSPGYVGHDSPEHVTKDLIDVRRPVSRVLTAKDLLGKSGFQGTGIRRGARDRRPHGCHEQ